MGEASQYSPGCRAGHMRSQSGCCLPHNRKKNTLYVIQVILANMSMWTTHGFRRSGVGVDVAHYDTRLQYGRVHIIQVDQRSISMPPTLRSLVPGPACDRSSSRLGKCAVAVLRTRDVANGELESNRASLTVRSPRQVLQHLHHIHRGPHAGPGRTTASTIGSRRS